MSAEEARILRRMGGQSKAPVVQSSPGLHIEIEGFVVEENKPIEIHVDGKMVYSRSKPGICSTKLPTVNVDWKDEVAVRMVITAKNFDQDLIVETSKGGYLRIVDTEKGLSFAQRNIPFGENPPAPKQQQQAPKPQPTKAPAQQQQAPKIPKFCGECGEKNEDMGRFCVSCGKKFV